MRNLVVVLSRHVIGGCDGRRRSTFAERNQSKEPRVGGVVYSRCRWWWRGRWNPADGAPNAVQRPRGPPAGRGVRQPDPVDERAPTGSQRWRQAAGASHRRGPQRLVPARPPVERRRRRDDGQKTTVDGEGRKLVGSQRGRRAAVVCLGRRLAQQDGQRRWNDRKTFDVFTEVCDPSFY